MDSIRNEHPLISINSNQKDQTARRQGQWVDYVWIPYSTTKREGGGLNRNNNEYFDYIWKNYLTIRTE